MNSENIIPLITGILTALVTAIPLVVKLVDYINKAVKEKNWSNLLTLVMNYMAQAEEKFTTGAEKKQWVLGMIEASAKTINYDIDMEEVSALIDSLCDLTKVVNVEEKAA